MDATDGLVELPTYAPAPDYEARDTKPRLPARKRATLLDRLVTTAGVDRVEIDLTALDTLRAE